MTWDARWRGGSTPEGAGMSWDKPGFLLGLSHSFLQKKMFNESSRSRICVEWSSEFPTHDIRFRSDILIPGDGSMLFRWIDLKICQPVNWLPGLSLNTLYTSGAKVHSVGNMVLYCLRDVTQSCNPSVVPFENSVQAILLTSSRVGTKSST